MTDMTVGFLFIVILLLAFFASQYDPATSVPLPVHESVVAERDKVKGELDVLKEALEARDATIAALRLELSQIRQTVGDLQSEKAVLEARIASLETDAQALNKTLESKDAVIAALRLELMETRRTVDDLQEEMTVLVKRIGDLESRIADLEIELALLRAPDPLETYINRSLAERKRILETLRDQIMLDFPELDVILSEESDALRFQGDGLFRSGAAALRPDRIAFVQTVATRLNALLPCYTLGPGSRWSDGCNPGHALIEAVQIEGHTDADGQEFPNLVLSTARANDTFRTMTDREPALVQHLNFRNQPVLSVAGYGKMRPVAGNDAAEGKAANRRIDLRIIMYVPSRSEEIETVRAALTASIAP